jgi:pimeloyl-ACP methyl ester carboxylesterase
MAAGLNETRAASNKFSLLSGAFPTPLEYFPRRGYAQFEERQVHFRDTGSGIPLVLCHQSPMTSKQFTKVYDLLSRQGIRAIGIDTPGYGESDPLPFVPTIEDWAPSFIAVIDHLKLEKVHILGHHTGAMIANEIAIQYPDRIQKLILNGPAISASEEERLASHSKKSKLNVDIKADGSHMSGRFTSTLKMFSSELLDPIMKTRHVIEKYQGYAPFWIGCAFPEAHSHPLYTPLFPSSLRSYSPFFIFMCLQASRSTYVQLS